MLKLLPRSTPRHNPCQRPGMNLASASLAQGGRQRIHRRSGGDDVVDDGDVQPLQVAANPERTAHVPVPLVSGQQGLRPGIRVPVDTANDQWQPGSRRHRACNLEGLIEAALDETPAVQRHGHQSVRLFRQTTTFQDFNQQQAQRPTHRSGGPEFHRLNVRIQRGFVEERRRNLLDAPALLGTGAPAYRPRQTATVAGISDSTDQRPAVRAQTRFGGPATALAKFRQQACQQALNGLPADVQLTDPGFRSNTPI